MLWHDKFDSFRLANYGLYKEQNFPSWIHPNHRNIPFFLLAFKLKSNIFVIGLFEDLNFDYYGHPYWRCDRFDIEKDEYQKSCHLISSNVKQIFSATTDSSESYALILTDSGLLTFTEDHGFKYEGFFRINRDSFRDSIRFIDSESDLSDFVSWESSAILRPCFASCNSSLFPIG